MTAFYFIVEGEAAQHSALELGILILWPQGKGTLSILQRWTVSHSQICGGNWPRAQNTNFHLAHSMQSTGLSMFASLSSDFSFSFLRPCDIWLLCFSQAFNSV